MYDFITVDVDTSSNVKPARVSTRSAIKVGSLSFSAYIGKRLLKDGLGFIPLVDKENRAYTQRGSHIVARVPENEVDFLIYCHELGHNKTHQPTSPFGRLRGTDKNCLIREYNAWRWGIRYFQRLGFKLTEDCKQSVKESFESYTDGVDKSLAKKFEDDLSVLVGTQICGTEPNKSGLGCYDSCKVRITFGGNGKTWSFGEGILWEEFTTTPKSKPKERPKNWKPWHDLKDKQIKKGWRNQR